MKKKRTDSELDAAYDRSRSEKAVFYKIPADDGSFQIKAMKPSIAMLIQKRQNVRYTAVG